MSESSAGEVVESLGATCTKGYDDLVGADWRCGDVGDDPRGASPRLALSEDGTFWGESLHNDWVTMESTADAICANESEYTALLSRNGSTTSSSSGDDCFLPRSAAARGIAALSRSAGVPAGKRRRIDPAQAVGRTLGV